MRMWIIPHQVKHWQICFFNWVLSSSETQLSQFDCETHGLGCQLTVSQFNLQISWWIIKSWNFLTVPVQIVLFQKICLHNERNENLILGETWVRFQPSFLWNIGLLRWNKLKNKLKMVTRHPMDVDTCEVESQTDTETLEP